MKDERNHIDHLFRAALDNHTEAPPPDVWAALEQRLPAEKRRRRWGWLWGTLVLLALLGGTAAVYSVLKKDSPKAGTGRVLADGNQPIDNPAVQVPANEVTTGATDPSLTPTIPAAPPTGNTTNNPAPAGRQRVAGGTPRNNQSSAGPQRTPRRANQATGNPQAADPDANPTARNNRPAGNRNGGNDPSSIAGNDLTGGAPASNRTRPGRRTPGRAVQNGNTTVAADPASAADQPTVGGQDVPGRRNGSTTGRNRKPRNGGNRTNSSIANPNTATDPGTTASAASGNPPRRRNGRAGGDVTGNGGSRRNAGNSGTDNRPDNTGQEDPASGIALASGDAGTPARKPKPSDGATAGRPKKPTRATNRNNSRKPDEGIDVPPSTARRDADNPVLPNRTGATAQRNDPSASPLTNPVQPTAANQPPADPAPQAGNKPGGRFSADDPRGDKGLLMSDYINKPGAGSTAAKDDDGSQGGDDRKTATTNAGGGGGGGGAAPDKPKAQPAPRGRWEGGVKLGYEIGAGGDHINKAVMGPYVQYNISDRAAVVFQPAYKSGQFKGGSKNTSETFIDITSPLTVNTSQFFVLDSSGGLFIEDTLYNQAVSQSYDSIIVSRKIDGRSFWEIDLPLLFSYQLSKMFSFFAGPVFSFNRQFTQSGNRETYTISQSQVFDSLQAPLSPAAYNGVLGGGQASFSGIQPTASSEVHTGMGMGYLAGVQARFGIISADLTVQQRLSGLPEKAKAPEVHSALSMPYIRLSLGVRLFGNGKKKPTDRDMLNEQPYQRTEE